MALLYAFKLFTMLLTISFLLQFPLSSQSKSSTGFTTNLIRRDHPPKYDGSSANSAGYFEWLSRSMNRSKSRADYFHGVMINSKQKYLSPTLMAVDAPVMIGEGDHIMEVSIGTPPVSIWARIDTGSDLAWTQCLPCIECYEQYDPFFDPEQSSTYLQLACDSQPCKAFPHSTPCKKSSQCTYAAGYMDASETRGDLAVDTFTFHSSDGDNISFPNTVFGCGHNNSGNFDKTESGIIGLDRGSLSIVNQFSSIISRKFSYCLAHVDDSPISKISFGVDAIPPGSKVAVSTPMVKGQFHSFYFVTLEAISIGSKRVEMFKTSSSQQQTDEGNMIIDSGTTTTAIPEAIYNDLRSALMDIIKAPPVEDPGESLNTLCYANDPSLNFPEFVFHFRDNADVVIPRENAFSRIEEKAVCWQIGSAGGGIGVFGNLFQTNILIEFDLDNELISFLPSNCSEGQ